MSKSPRIILGVADSITSGAAVVINGRVKAAVNEERLCRVKMAMGWPRLSIEAVLRIAGVEAGDVDAVAVATRNLYWRSQAESIRGYFGADWGRRKNLALALGSVGSRVLGDVHLARKGYYAIKGLLTRKRRALVRQVLRAEHGVTAPVEFVDHHLAHAASAYYTGGQADAMIATLDGAGDSLSATVWRGRAGGLERVHAVDSYDSVGNYYSYVTHLLGFKAHQHEGKITGLAAYGRPVYTDRLRTLVSYRDGTIRNTARAFHTAAVDKLRRLLPADAEREDVAASMQALLEEVCVGYVSYWTQRLDQKHLGVAGGVVANVKLNQRLLDIPGVESLFVHPGMGDDGLAVGAALDAAARALPPPRREAVVHAIPDVYWGPAYSDAEIRAALDSAGLAYRRPENLADAVAEALVRKQVVARFDGRMEYGPRALGNRSILVHAGDPTVNDWLNHRLQRTEFMPFAPVTLEEEASDHYANLAGAHHTARFMTITTDCRDGFRKSCPATVHIDGTARPQLVGPDDNPAYRAILEAYRARTGFSTIINTSFNMHEEPIVCTPADAIRAFQLGHLDLLAIGGYVVRNPEAPSRKVRDAIAATTTAGADGAG